MSVLGIILGAASLVLIALTFAEVAEPEWAFIALGIVVFLKVGLKVVQNTMLERTSAV